MFIGAAVVCILGLLGIDVLLFTGAESVRAVIIGIPIFMVLFMLELGLDNIKERVKGLERKETLREQIEDMQQKTRELQLRVKRHESEKCG